MVLNIKKLIKENLGNVFVYRGQDFCVSSDEVDDEGRVECIAIGDGQVPKGLGHKFTFAELSGLLKEAESIGVVEDRLKKVIDHD